MYAIIPQSPPCTSCLLLAPDKQEEALLFLRKVYELTTTLEASHDPLHQTFWADLPVLRWIVNHEVLAMLETAKWDLSCTMGQRVLSYVKCMFSDSLLNTLGLENGFNDLRDNESRGARHHQRSASTLQSLSISSQHTRYDEHLPLIQVADEEISKCNSYHCDNAIHGPEACDVKNLGFNVRELEAGGWPSTTTHLFSHVQLSLLHALLKTDVQQWSSLWMVGLLRPHMVISGKDSKVGYYVIGAEKWTASLLELEGEWPNFSLGASSRVCVHQLEPLVSLDSYYAHDYIIAFETGREVSTYTFHHIEMYSLPEHCARRWLHLLPVERLKMWLKHLKTVTKG